MGNAVAEAQLDQVALFCALKPYIFWPFSHQLSLNPLAKMYSWRAPGALNCATCTRHGLSICWKTAVLKGSRTPESGGQTAVSGNFSAIPIHFNKSAWSSGFRDVKWVGGGGIQFPVEA